MLEVPLERNEVPDLMMEDEDVRPATEAAVKRKIDEVARGEENGGKKMISARRKVSTRPQCHREHRIHRDSILKIGMKLDRKKMSGRHHINGKGLQRVNGLNI